MSNLIKSRGKIRGVYLMESYPLDTRSVPAKTKEKDDNKEKPQLQMAIEEVVASRLEGLRREFQREKEEAYRSGFERGKQVGIQMGKGEIELALESLKVILKGLDSYKEKLLEDMEPIVVELAYAIAEKVIRAEVKANPEVVLNTVKAALEHVMDREKLIIRVNPDDLNSLKGYRQQLLSVVNGLEGLEIKEDARIARGGCVVETNSGTIDARLEAQLAEIHRALLEGLESGRSEGEV